MQASVTALATKPDAVSRILADAGVRRSEWVILVFLVYAAIVGRALPIAPSLQTRTVVVNLAILIIYGQLIRADAVRPRRITSMVRDWVPLAVIILAYREMGWFALPRPGHELEMRLVGWDRAFLRGGAKAAIESLGPVLPSILEIAYALVYALAPFCLAVLYSSGRRNDAERFLFVFATAVLLTYAQLPLWPSEPPRTVFPGEDVPACLTMFRRFNLWTLAGCGIHTGVFPSAHVAGAFAAAFGMKRAGAAQRWVHALLFTVAALIALATVYGRYHYLADAVAGLAMATLAVAFSHLVDSRRDGTIAFHKVGPRTPMRDAMEVGFCTFEGNPAPERDDCDSQAAVLSHLSADQSFTRIGSGIGHPDLQHSPSVGARCSE